MITALVVLLTFTSSLVLLDLAAGVFGVDSRDGFADDRRDSFDDPR
jgi:hypothetical protein